MDALERASAGDAAWFSALDDDALERAMTRRDDDGRTSFHRACAAGARGRDVTRLARERMKGEAMARVVTTADDGGWTPLHTSAALGERVEGDDLGGDRKAQGLAQAHLIGASDRVSRRDDQHLVAVDNGDTGAEGRLEAAAIGGDTNHHPVNGRQWVIDATGDCCESERCFECDAGTHTDSRTPLAAALSSAASHSCWMRRPSAKSGSQGRRVRTAAGGRRALPARRSRGR